MMYNPDEVRAEFNRQHRDYAGPAWVRLNLRTGPVLARRNTPHHSAPIYFVVNNQTLLRHYMVTEKRQLKSNGSTNVSPEIHNAWVRLIGYTPQEYEAAKRSDQQVDYTKQLIEKYEGVNRE